MKEKVLAIIYDFDKTLATKDMQNFKFIENNFNPTRDDLVIVSDVDEILTRNALRYVIEHPPISLSPPREYYVLHGDYYFPFYFHRLNEWDAAMIFSYTPGISIAQVRVRVQNGQVFKLQTPNHEVFVTHCSYCFRTLEEYKRKLQTFTHQEFNKPPYTTNDWIFKSHYCRFTVNAKEKKGIDEPDTDYSELIPNDERVRFLYDPSYEYNISLTSYTQNDLLTLCEKQWRRSLK